MSRPLMLGGNAVVLAALAACADTNMPAYYPDGTAPTIESVDPAFELGNMGSQRVTIVGTGFGTDPADLVVTIGSHNARILEASDTSVIVETPPGPLSGGAVDVVVATAGGVAWGDGTYEYDVTFGNDTSMYDGEAAYLSIQNLWTSCLGGMWAQTGTALEGGGCETIAYVGSTGITGASEWWMSPWPRGHADQVGWVGNTDFAPGWVVQRAYTLNSVSSYDSLRVRMNDVWLENPVWEGESECVDPTEDPADNGTACSADDAAEYDLDKLRFCEQHDPDSGGTRRFVADWNVKRNFFAHDDNDDANFEPVEVTLHVEGFADKPDVARFLPLDGSKITLPGSTLFRAVDGFGDSDADAEAWAAGGTPETCLDADGDGSAMLDEDGVVLEWDPIPDDADIGGDNVTAHQSYVMVSVTWLPLGWFGLAPGGPRASIVVPDVDGTVSIPNSVLYQFPSPNFDYFGVNDVSGVGRLGTWESNAAYLLIEAYRYTDLRLEADGSPPLVVSYVTGDLSFVAGWNNPTERDDDCDDCIDGDLDGWVDGDDPDCMKDGSGTEENATSASTCNDGIDNNGDGDIDAEDDLCSDGADGETTCDNDEDDDGDGWTDGLDSECIAGGDQEAGDDDPSATCSNGLDDDNDGWIDAADPACTDGADPESDGFGTTACNDGLDNDGHGDIDAADPYCAEEGPTATSETVAVPPVQCTDTTDNDGDGFFDVFDPDCEIYPREVGTSWDSGDSSVIPACYDGKDNDGDGREDAEDPSCWRGDLLFQADGFLDDEAKDWGTACTDGLDNDADGWPDAKDPDCAAGSATTQVEVGFGTAACNDGVDNSTDSDTLADAADVGCTDGFDNIE